MDLSAFLNLLLATDNPVLPDPGAMRLALHGAWAIMLGCGALWMAGKLSRPYRLGLAVLVMVWTLVPGTASPAYWLGLAFQTPSLTSAVIGLAWFSGRARLEQLSGVSIKGAQVPTLKILAAMGVVLGWILLLDTLAWLPVSVYAWGFSSAAFGVAAMFAMLLWAMLGAVAANRRAAGLVGFLLTLTVLMLFVLTRLPTGNLWDALIDPWLWVSLQLGWLVSAGRRLMAARRSPPATRA